jgi:hypothetical protein
VLQLSLRPFEVLMLEIKSGSLADRSLPVRVAGRVAPRAPSNPSPVQVAERMAPRAPSDSLPARVRRVTPCAPSDDLGISLPLKTTTLDPRMDIRFADAAHFEAQKFKKKTYAFETQLPSLDGPQPMLAVAIRLKKDNAEWRYKPTVVQIVQAYARVADENVQMIPVPDSRQYGNTQADGCSWVLYKVRLSRQWSGKPLKLAVHAYLPDGVEPEIESWVIKRWWQEDSRPQSDGYYTDEPS